MLKTSQKAGGGSNIGDVVHSVLDVLPDGRRLLPLDRPRRLSNIEYPLLTAALGQTLNVTETYLAYSGINYIGILDPGNPGYLIRLQPSNGANSTTVQRQGYTAANWSDITAIGPFEVGVSGFCMSSDGQKMFWVHEQNSSPPGQRQVSRTLDGGATVTSDIALPVSNNSNSRMDWLSTAIQCDPTGTNVVVAVFDDAVNNNLAVMTSNNQGTTWSSDVVRSKTLTHADSVIDFVHISDDLNQLLYCEYHSTLHPKTLWRSRGGLAFVDITAGLLPYLKNKTRNPLAFFYPSASKDGQVIIVHEQSSGDKTVDANVNKGIANDNIFTLIISTDGGDTWKDISLLPEFTAEFHPMDTGPIVTVSDDNKYAVIFIANEGQEHQYFYLYDIVADKYSLLTPPGNMLGGSALAESMRAVENWSQTQFHFDGTDYWLLVSRRIITSGNNIFKLELDYWLPTYGTRHGSKIIADPAV